MSLDHPFIDTRIADAMQSLGGMDEQLPAAIISAGQTMAGQLANDQKIMTLGLGSMAPLAQMFCNRLLVGNAQLRPALPALLLHNAIDAKTLGKPGDCLLIVGESLAADAVQQSINNALAAGVMCIVLGKANAESDFPATEQVLYLPVVMSVAPDTTNLTRIQELTLFILNCLSDTIEEQLFGSY